MITLGIIVVLGVFFYAGVCWKSKSLGNAERYEVKTPLEIQISPGMLGVIPIGAVLYKYQELPEIDTYYLFVNLKERDTLTPYSKENHFNLVVPVTAYPQDKSLEKGPDSKR
jgi:hypothetical protein